MGAKLKRAGYDDFIILEKADSLGGTWRENRYPGAECDVASVLYSYSFYPNPTWDFKWAKQKQILAYLDRFTEDMGLRSHIHFEKAVSKAVYNETTACWDVETKSGEHYSANFLIPALGQLHHPQIPEIPGQSENTSHAFHTAQWPDDVDLKGKDIAVIGNAASAIQLIPEAAKDAAHLTVYQRSANWIIPKRDRPYTAAEKGLAKRMPWLSKVYRLFWFMIGEWVLYPMIKGRKFQSWLGARLCKSEMRKHIRDKDKRASLTPNYPIGAKRILLSEVYYPALARDNVSLVTDPIEKLTDKGIKGQSGTARDHDIIVYATGFATIPFYKNISITGKGGVSLQSQWSRGAQAYYGVVTADFPNMFMLYGPNTNTGHTSIVFKLENQVNYILQLLDGHQSSIISVKSEAEARYADTMQQRLQKTSWAKIENSWYKHGDKIDRNWPGSGIAYKRMMKTVVWDDYDVCDRPQSACEKN